MSKEKEPKEEKKLLPAIATFEIPQEDKREGCEFSVGEVSLSTSGDLGRAKKVFFELLDKIDFKRRKNYIG